MNKRTKIIVTIMVMMIIAIIVFLIYVYTRQEDAPENMQINVSNSNMENINDVSNNVVQENNIVQNNTVENNAVREENIDVKVPDEPVEEPQAQNNILSSNSELSSVNDDEKAIEIAKEAWGDPEGVYFSNQGIKSNGEYIVTVTANATVLAYYYVNVNTGEYTVEYN